MIKTLILAAILVTTPTLMAQTPQVSGWPAPPVIESTGHPTCDLGQRVTDREHPALHTCPVGFSQSDCWWAWHCCVDEHGHPLTPLLNEELTCASREDRTPRCGATADYNARLRTCIPHVGAHATPEAIAEFRRLFG